MSEVALIAHNTVAIVFEVAALGCLVFGVVDLRAVEVFLMLAMVLLLVLHVLRLLNLLLFMVRCF